MSAKVVAVYSLKGGVGKTTLAVNLAWAAAALSARRTLLWDLDGQAAATWILGHEPGGKDAKASIRGTVDPRKLVRATAYDRLALLPADASLRSLDVVLNDIDKKKTLAKLAAGLGREYDRIVVDCPPGLGETSDQILRAADLVLVPVIPSPLAQRAFDSVRDHIAAARGADPRVLPVFSMVDGRRALHRQALVEQKRWPVVPMASAFEAMAARRAPLGSYAPRTSRAVAAVELLWRQVERTLAQKS